MTEGERWDRDTDALKAGPSPTPLVIHPHFHRRRTGVTAHTELIVPELSRLMETRALGKHLAADVPRITWGELWRCLREEPLLWHAHRNNELLFGFLLRLLGKEVRLERLTRVRAAT
jgi:mannosyltransferase